MNKRAHAILSDAVYYPPEFSPSGRPVDINVGEETFVAVEHMDMSSGYQGTIFRNESSGDYVIAHRGTEFDRELLKDGVVDMVMVTGRFNAQLKDALELTRIAKGMAERDGKQLSVTGHSLGGGLGQVCAHHYNLPGDAFNPYGVVSLGYRIEEGQPAHAAPFTNHVMAGDFVSAGSKHYGSVQTYALPSELKTLREAEIAAQPQPVVELPPLVHGYLRMGARVLGAPAWDPDFQTADLPIMLQIADLPARYRRMLGC